MASLVVIRRDETGDVIHERITSIIKDQVFSDAYLSQRFGLEVGSINRITVVNEIDNPSDRSGITLHSAEVDSKRFWTLRGGCSYRIIAEDDVRQGSPTVWSRDKAKRPMEVTELWDDSDDDDDDVKILNVVKGSSSHPEIFDEKCVGSIEDEAAQRIAPEEVGDQTLKMYRISALESVLAIKGHSEIFRFVKKGTFSTRQVRCLPPGYNGDIIFELPPIEGDVKKGDRVRSMERSKDCYYWTRTIPTSASVPKKGNIDLWQFGKMNCTGSLECRNDNCEFFDRNGCRNASAWNGNYKISTVHNVNEAVEEGGLVCGFCSERPFCISSCPAMMFYMYPSTILPKDVFRDHMSRLAIHVGSHVHPPRTVFARVALQKVEALLGKHHTSHPSASPSHLKNIAIGDLLAQFQEGSACGLTKEDEIELWESLQVISTPQKFTSLLRSVRRDSRDWKGNGIFDSLQRMQTNIVFPYIQRYRVPGQGSEVDFPFIFKMSVKGEGSGVDILRRMLPGKNLDGTWVMFDVMKRITTGWLTFSAHVYDHNYRALCTIFTCELMAEDGMSCQIAWRQMIDVARQHGVPDVHIHGFMADNAIGGWNAVRDVFFDGIRDPERERSDAFHWKQSIRRHTIEGIKEGSRAQHLLLWRKLRDAKNVVEAYKISHEITAFWNKGNCYPEKLRFLQGWLAWWVVRWTQWGNYIRQNLTAEESVLMVNCTGAESVHASMRKCLPQRKVGLIEACEMDQNRAAAQIAAYTAYLNGANRGKGPTLFELAFRAADIVGTPAKFIEATNLWAELAPKYDLCRSGPLNGDVQTKSQKRKGPASAKISLQDSHRPETVLVTSPNAQGFRRKNLLTTDFERIPVDDPSVGEPLDGARVENDVSMTPSRRVTRSFCEPSTPSPTMHPIRVQEIDVPRGTWHLRRTSARRHKGPMCNGTCAGRSLRTDCRNYIKMVGYQPDTLDVGVVGIAFDGYSTFRGVAIPSLLWFCPNNLCHRSRAQKSVSGLSPVPSILQVQRGTLLSPAEIHFLTSKGLDFVGRPPHSGVVPEHSILRIDVDNYPETIDIDDPTRRSKFRNGKRIRQRNVIIPDHLKAIERAEREDMRIISERDVMTGNGFGKQFCLRSHKNDDTLATKEYWIQICCFPTCSCDNFFSHHWYKKSFLLCKHLYWVFLNVFRLNIRTNLLIIQPVLTVSELKQILDRESDMV